MLSGSGEVEILYSFNVTSDHLKNSYWLTSMRHDYVQSGTVYYKMFKVERGGEKATDWTPAPEDIQEQIETLETNITANTSSITNVEVLVDKQQKAN